MGESQIKKSQLGLKLKFIFSILFAAAWLIFSIYVAEEWMAEVESKTSIFFMYFAIIGIAFIPGFIIFFLYGSLALDKRVEYDMTEVVDATILIAAFNEEENILKPLESLNTQKFNGKLEVIVIDDGSTDNTSKIASSFTNQNPKFDFKLITLKENQGKSGALNEGLRVSKYETIATMDADTTLGTNDAVQRLVSSLNGNYKAVAGAVVSRNPNKNWITRLQEWDYLFGISIVKRIQSMYSGTLVCQGAFSAYRKDALIEAGGWKHVVGEDIVLTWDMLNKGHKTYHNPDAIALTETPDTYKQFFHQRKRWSRGMIEAFRSNWKMLFKFKLSTIFVWYNLLFPYIDAVFAFIFIPAVVGAMFFEFYLMASWKTLLVIPLSLLFTTFLYFIQKRTMKRIGLGMSKNFFGMFLYVILFQIIQTPATLAGYFSEIFKLKKNWGTKKSKNLVITILMVLASTVSFAQDKKIESGGMVLADTDKNISLKSWVGYSQGTESLKWTLGGGNIYVKDKTKSNSLGFARFGIDTKFSKYLSGNLLVEQAFGNWNPLLYEATFKMDSISNFHIELFSSRSIVDAAQSMDQKIAILSNGVSLDYSLFNKKLILVGGYINQQFTDNNTRNVYLGKVMWVVKDLFVLQTKARLLRINEWSPYYFSPDVFDTYTFGAYKYAAILNDKFLIKPELGVGIQKVYDDNKDFWYAGMLLRGDLSKRWSIELTGRYSTATNNYGSYGLFMGSFKLSYKFIK